MDPFRPLSTLDARKTPGISRAAQRLSSLARAGVLVPEGAVLTRGDAGAWLEALHAPSLAPWLDPRRPEATAEAVHEAWSTARERALPDQVGEALASLAAWLEGQGATAFSVTASIVCDRPEHDRALGPSVLAVEGAAKLGEAVRGALLSLYDVELLRRLREHHVSDAGVCIVVQRMVEGTVSGVVYTRHPLMGDDQEWLVRAGFGLTNAVRRGQVPSDVFRVTRSGLVRDRVVVDKHSRSVALPDRTRALREVPEAARRRPGLSDMLLSDVLKAAARVERCLGATISADWAIAQGRVYIVRAEPAPSSHKPRKPREADPRAERDLWSSRELGEAVPDVPTPLTWSLLRRFSRLGLTRTLGAAGATVGETTLVTEVRGHAYVNIGALTQAICRLPFVSPAMLASVGLEPAIDVQPQRASALGLARAALSIYDSQVRYRGRLTHVADRVSRERAHFSGLDPRLLSPDALERVLCDAELWLRDSGEALMRCYGLWLTALVALRALLRDHLGDEALRVERDLLWGAAEIAPVASAEDMLSLARTLQANPTAVAWAERAGPAPAVVSASLNQLALRHRQQGMVLMDPHSPRWFECLPSLSGALRVLLGDPMAFALALDRVQIARGRRERAEREVRRRLPLSQRPLSNLLVRRVRDLTRTREQLLFDAAQAITVLREIASDASRRLSARDGAMPPDAAFFLDLGELHSLLLEGPKGLEARIAQRHVEHTLQKGLPPAASRFALRAREAAVASERLIGIQGSTGAGEGRVVRVRDGSELEALPRAAVLVVRSCDVGLAPILPAVRAVISEAGGLLSHGTMLGGALGVPVVVGVDGAMARLSEGQRVRVDADRAEITSLEGAS